MAVHTVQLIHLNCDSVVLELDLLLGTAKRKSVIILRILTLRIRI